MSKDISFEILKYLNYENGFYIECGANDGVFQSNTLKLEQNKNWKGILIEPSPVGFENCKLNRSDKNIFVNCALVSDDYEEDYVVGSFASGGARGKIEGSLIRGSSYIQVPAKTLNEILEEYQILSVDFFSLDVEGFELQVLKGLDFEKYKIQYILLEYNIGEEDVFDFLNEKDYENLGCLSDFNKIDDPHWPGTHNDYLFKRR